MDAQVKTRKAAKEGASEKRKKFVRLAQSRTVNAIRAIRVIGKLGNKSHYEYGEADVKKIATALSKEIDALKSRMSDQGGKAEVEFKL
ncbi:MAG: hypothetical protein WA210_16210 [Burkholderiaceae bacterium]